MSRLRQPLFWILILAAVLRLAQLTAPPVGRHAWRQSDTAGVARNFHRFDGNLLMPQIDWQIPGYVEMEFPIYPWAASQVYSLTGVAEAVPRLLAVLGSLVTVAFLYLLVARILDRKAALWATLLYSILPANLFFGRAIMPESWMLAASVVALYGFVRWIDEETWTSYCLAIAATALACLLKPTSLYLGLPFLWLAWRKWGAGSLQRWRLWLLAGLVTATLVLWYGHAFRLGQQYGASFHVLTAAGEDKWGTWSLLFDPAFYHRVFVGYLGERLLTWIGWPLFLVGLTLRRRSPEERLFDVWLLAVVVVLLLVGGGSFQHDYYSLPIVLPAVVFMGKVFAREWGSYRSWLAVALAGIAILSGYRYLGDLARERRVGSNEQIAEVLRTRTETGDLLISCRGADPVWLYLADRRGFGRECDRLGRTDLEDLIDRGARYLVAAGSGTPSSIAGSGLAAQLRVFHEVVIDDETTFLARLGSPFGMDEIVWQSVYTEAFTTPERLDRWSVEGGEWAVEEGALVGTLVRHSSSARSTSPLPPCGVCRLQLTVSVSPPPAARDSDGGSRRHRGTGRGEARGEIDLWASADGAAVTLALKTRGRNLGLIQTLGGVQVEATRVEAPIALDEPFDLELRSDGLGFELRLDGEEVLTTSVRLAMPLHGGIVVRPLLGTLRIHRIEVLAVPGEQARPTESATRRN